MRILVISDSHKNPYVVDKIIRNESTAKQIFFLGDVTEDIENLVYEYPDRTFHIVSGNCDGISRFGTHDIVTVGGVDIFYTHGHLFDVNYGTEKLENSARGAGAKIALFGHTHIACSFYRDGLYVVNPGSCARPRDGAASYAVIDITDSGILPAIITEF